MYVRCTNWRGLKICIICVRTISMSPYVLVDLFNRCNLRKILRQRSVSVINSNEVFVDFECRLPENRAN